MSEDPAELSDSSDEEHKAAKQKATEIKQQQQQKDVSTTTTPSLKFVHRSSSNSGNLPTMSLLSPKQSSLIGETALDLVYFYSCPLVVNMTGSAESTPLKLLDIPGEIALLKDTFETADKQIRVKFDWGCVDNLRCSVTTGCRAIHYSGHGFPTGLAFEDKNGSAHMFEANVLRALVAAGDQMNVQFVFVSACHSEEAGKAFADAGVPHVVAVKWDTPISDKASQVFSKHFYLSLLVGKTVRASFDVGMHIVMADPEIRQKDEHKKFLLLPEDGNHDVPIFEGIVSGKWINHSSKPSLTNIRANPEKFLGRQVEAQKIFKLLFEKRLITVFGERGIGKSALAKFLGNFACERRRFDGVFWIPLGKAMHRRSEFKCLGDIFASELHDLVGEKSFSINREFISEMSKSKFKEKQLLFIVDGADSVANETKNSNFYVTEFLSDLLEILPGLTVLMTARRPLSRINDVQNYRFPIHPLSDQDSAQLFTSLTRPLTNEDFGLETGRPLERLAKHETIQAMKGNPGLIVVAADKFSMSTKTTLSSLKENLPELWEIMLKEDAEETPEEEYTRKGTENKENDWNPVKKPGVGKAAVKSDKVVDLFKENNVTPSAQNFWSFGENVPIPTFFKQLNKYFLVKTGTTDRPLSKEDCEFFKSLLRKRFQNESDSVVTIKSFAGFWIWFEAFSDAIADAPEVWTCLEPQIMYLNTSADANFILSEQQNGSFLIRFSERRDGYLDLSYRQRDKEDKKKINYYHSLFHMTDQGWMYDGNLGETYDSIAELLSRFIAGKYVGDVPKKEVLDAIGFKWPKSKSATYGDEEGPD